MKTKMVLGAVIGTLCWSVSAIPIESGYKGISERNVFGLTPEPPPKIEEKPPPPQAKLFLVGYSTIGGIKRAFLRGQFPAQPRQPAKGESVTLSEGQGEAGIEGIPIDEKGKQVTGDYERSP